MSDPRRPGPTGDLVRRLWHRLEHLHAVTYFHEACRDANKAIGLRGFWMGYFGTRAAPLGPVGPGVVEALFFNFAPAMVRRSIPDAWSFADPPDIVEARGRAAASALRELVPGVEQLADEACGPLGACVRAAPGAGRPLFAANRDVPVPEDPVTHLWQLTTALREHRGDAHVAVLGSWELSGCEPHLLLAAGLGFPPAVLQDNRGWTTAAWEESKDRLVGRGLMTPDGGLSEAGRALRTEIEVVTDRLAAAAYAPCDAAELRRLVALLDGPANLVSRSGVVPYPNPIGLPPVP